MNKEHQGLELSRVIFIGRTYDEYINMFDLTIEEQRNFKILDAPAGACSFTAQGRHLGYDITATDIAYYHAAEQLSQKGKEDIKHAVEGLTKVKEKYIWNYFDSLEQLERHRNSALDECVKHMEKSPEYYIPAVLPTLPFDNHHFDMILSAHFLFMYADRFDLNFHLDTLKEFTRVARREIRIFPLTDLFGNRYVHLQEFLDYAESLGWLIEERKVPYEFQMNGNSMLRLYKE